MKTLEKPYFVMLYNQKGDRVVPLTDDNGEVRMFADEDDAYKTANVTFYGSNFGFDIFEMGNGLSTL